MTKELTDIDKTVRKIKRLLDFHRKQNENLELDEVVKGAVYNLYLVGRFSSGTIYEQKHIATIQTQEERKNEQDRNAI